MASQGEKLTVETPTQPVTNTTVEEKIKVNTPAPLRQRPGGISITAIQETSISTSEDRVSDVSATLIQNQPFSLAELEKTWYQYGETIADQGRMMALILNTKPTLLSTTEFEVTVSNLLLERELKKMQGSILAFMHSKLKNSQIQMTLKIAEETEATRATSPEERYRKMAEQNAALTTLRNGLQMEID